MASLPQSNQITNGLAGFLPNFLFDNATSCGIKKDGFFANMMKIIFI
jgi:hypothetical protein